MLSLKRNTGGGLSLLDKAVDVENKLIIPRPSSGYNGATTWAPITPLLEKPVKIKKDDFVNRLATLMSRRPITSVPSGETVMAVMAGGSPVQEFPVEFLPVGNTPDVTPEPMSLNVTGSGSLKTANMTLVAAVVKHVGATTTAVNSNVRNRALKKNITTVEQVTAYGGTGTAYEELQVMVKESWGVEHMNAGRYNTNTRVCGYHAADDKETASIQVLRLGNPFQQQYKLLYNRGSTGDMLSFDQSATGTIPVGTVLDFIVAYRWDNTWYGDLSKMQSVTIDASGAVEVSPRNGTANASGVSDVDWVGVVNNTLVKLSGPLNRNNQIRILYKLRSSENWIVQYATGSFVIANMPSAGTEMLNTSNISITSAAYLYTKIRLKTSDDYILGSSAATWDAFSLRFFNGGSATPGVEIGSGYDYTHDGHGVYTIMWTSTPVGTLPPARGDEFSPLNVSCTTTIETPFDPDATSYSMYVKFTTSSANGGISSANATSWHRVYSGPNNTYTWAGGGATKINPPTVNNTEVREAGPIAYLTWPGANTELTIAKNQYLAMKASTVDDYIVTIPAELVP